MTPQIALNGNIPQPHTPEPRTRHHVRILLENLSRRCHQWRAARQATAAAAARAAERDAERTALPPHAGLHAVLLLALLVAAYWIDVMVSGSVLEYLVVQQLHLSAGAAERIRWTAPLIILALEVALAVRVAHEEMHRIPGETRRSGGDILRILVLLAMLALTFATRLPRLPEAGSPEATVARFWVMNIGLLALTLLAHGTVLYSGRQIEEAWHYATARARCWSAHGEVGRQEAAAVTAIHLVRETFERYCAARNDYNRRHPAHAIPAGPFDQVTRSAINDIYGDGLIGGPSDPPVIGTPIAPARSRPPATAGELPPAGGQAADEVSDAGHVR